MSSYMVKGLNKVGAAFEMGMTVAAASASVVARGVPAAIVSHKECSGRDSSMGPLSRDPFSGPRRKRALTSPQRALDTLEPYGKLHLDVYAGKDLVPKDEGVLRKTSDPFVEVYVNDVYQGTSRWRAFTNNPVWNFQIALDVHSPLAIVRVQVVDRDNLKNNDLIGFVEFSVADLELNKSVVGWFELRPSDKLAGLAPMRLAGHMRRREDESYDEVKERKHERRRPSGGHLLAASQLGRMAHAAVVGPTLSEKPAVASPASAAPKPLGRSWTLPIPSPSHRARLQRAPCCGRLPLEDTVPGEPHEEGGGGASSSASPKATMEAPMVARTSSTKVHRRNGGEVHMQLRFEALEEDEWYAFCLPSPEFSFMPDVHLNLSELYTQTHDVITLFSSIYQKFLCVPIFLLTWKCWQLTLSLLLWWCLAWLWPLEFLPLAPLWCALLLWLLRQEKWNKRIFWHSNVAPLSQDGFALVASFRDTSRMESWMRRVLGTLGLEATEPSKLREFAGLTFRNGKPVMHHHELVDMLRRQPWVQNTSHTRRCDEGHSLICKGLTTSEPWTCMHRGGCQHPLTNKFKGSVIRYHCDACCLDLCEPCVASRSSRPPAWAGIPAHFLPPGLLVFLTKLAQTVDSAHTALNSLMATSMEIPFDREAASNAKAKRAYLACVLAWLGLTMLVQLSRALSDEAVGVAFQALVKLLGMLVVFLPLAARTSFALSLATQFRANAELKKYQERRAAGGCAVHWAFFRPAAVVEGASRPSQGNCSPSECVGALTEVRVAD